MDAELIRNFKLIMLILKYIPLVLAVLTFLMLLLQIYSPYIIVLGYFGGTSFLSLLFFYLSSYVFRFCEYHRMPLHYLTIVTIISLVDLFIGIPISFLSLIIIHISLFISLIISIIYFKYGKFKKFNCKRSQQISV